MKTLGYFVGGVFIFVSSLLVMFVPGLPKYANASAQPYLMGFIFLVWGILLVHYQTKSYKGGAASIVGAFLLGIGIWNVCGEFLWKEHATTREAWIIAVAEAIFVVSGTALLIQGHRIHKANAKQNKDI